METEKIIENIISGDSSNPSEEFLAWAEESEENRKEYIRYKNTWALLQQGREMGGNQIARDFKRVKARLNKRRNQVRLIRFIRYAAIVIVALIGGFLLNTLTSDVENEMGMNEVSVPLGNRSLIALPDGSKAWLTNGSKLAYPEKWGGNAREVTLEGEAYFTVAHKAENPFYVNLGKHRVKVLGTEFSVVSYPNDNFIQVDLVSGSVQMDVAETEGNFKSYDLKSLQSLVFEKTSGNLAYSKIPDSFFNYWQKGIYVFTDERFDSLAKKIERIYGIGIIFEDSTIEKRTFTGTFSIDDNIYTMMEVFKRASGQPFDYRIENKRIYIKSVK